MTEIHLYIYTICMCMHLFLHKYVYILIHLHKSSTWKAPSFSIHDSMTFLIFWGSHVTEVFVPCRKLTYPTVEQGKHHLQNISTLPFEEHYSPIFGGVTTVAIGFLGCGSNSLINGSQWLDTWKTSKFLQKDFLTYILR